LLRDPELQLDLNWREETQPNAVWAERYDPAFERAMLFLERSEQQRNLEIAEKERQRKQQLQWTRRLAIILGSAAIVTLVFGLYAMTLKIEADENYREAVKQKEIALAQQKEAMHQRSLADEQRSRAETQRQRADSERERAEEERQRAQTQEQEALRQKAQAESARTLETQARTEAENQRSFAVEQKERAEGLRVLAETSETETRRLRMLAVARGLAIQTTRLAKDEQRELAALLAARAYALHLGNGGSPEDAQQFEALRAALVRLAPARSGVQRFHQDAVIAVALSPLGPLVASGSDDGTVHLVDADAPDRDSRVVGRLGSEVRALLFVDGGKRLAAGTLDGRTWLLDTAPGAGQPQALSAPGAGLTALAFRQQGNLLAAATTSGEVRLLPLDQPGTARLLPPAAGPVKSLAFAADGALLGASEQGGLTRWSLGRDDAAPTRFLAERKLRAVATSADGAVAVGTVEGPILLYAHGLDGPPVELAGHTSTVTALSFGAQGSRLASASLDDSVRLWDVRTPSREPIVLSGHAGWVWAVALSADGQRLVSGGADRTVRFWPTQAQPMVAEICGHVTRDLTPEEWAAYLPTDIPRQPTCAATGTGRARASR
jgi:hypothetical protein